MRLVLAALLVAGIFAFSGAPGACDVPSSTSMSPQQTTSFPGTLTGMLNLTNPSYQGSTPYTMTLTNAGGIKGLLVHFTDAAGARRGSFTVVPTFTSNNVGVCGGTNNDPNSALGHNSQMQQQPCVGTGTLACAATSVTWTWTAPSTARGDLTMAIVLVQNIASWWRTTVTVSASAGAPPPPPPPPVPAPPSAPTNAPTNCVAHCDEMMLSCSNQFTDVNTCLRYCATYPPGAVGTTSGNTFVCRDYHLAVAKTLSSSPNTQRWHCSHAGPTGGFVCTDTVSPATLCDSYCRASQNFCNTSATRTYSDYTTCMAVCPYIRSITTPESTRTSSSLEFDISKTSGDSIECRSYHLMVASQGGASGTVHCPHSGQDGGDGVCGTVCEAYCDIYMGVCPTAYPAGVYASRSACLSACAGLDKTAPLGAVSGNTVQCRLYHASVAAQVSPATHCQHAALVSVDGALPGPCADPCADYCNEIMATCSAGNSTPIQHSSMNACMIDCAAQAAGQPGATSGNSLGCRRYHVGVATGFLGSSPTAARQHCAHGGPSGAQVCGTPCEVYCNTYDGVCSGRAGLLNPYSSVADCMTFCNFMNKTDIVDTPAWSTSITSGNTLGCRTYHMNVAGGTNDVTHCDHASWDGGNGVCGTPQEQYCQYFSQACPTLWTANYAGTKGTCLAAAAAFPAGTAADTSGNTFGCRLYHLSVAVRLSATAGLDNVHCEHASLTGGTVCSSLCPDYCTAISTNCTGSALQFGISPSPTPSPAVFNTGACLAACQQTVAGSPGDVNTNTVQCRMRELALANTNCAVSGIAGNSTAGTTSCGSLCENYCERITATCVGANAQYGSEADCLSLCAQIPVDTVDTNSNIQIDTYIQCRFYYLVAALVDPVANCPKAGFLGGGVCGNVVTNFCQLYPLACPVAAAADIGTQLCDDVFSVKPLGVIGDTSGDTAACRGYHVQVAYLGTPNNVHCTHASLNGGGVCVPPVSCAKLCTDLAATCTGANQVNVDAPTFNCTAWCAELTLGASGATSGNTVACRQYHVGVAAAGAANAAVHCPHAGFSGGAVCGDACDVYCQQIMTTCTGANAQYSSTASCKAICGAFNQSYPFVTSTTSGPSLACRSYHLQVATSDPNTHCYHAGPTGGEGVCGTGCDAYCDLMMDTCVSPNIPTSTFATRDACMTACAGYDNTGSFGDTIGNTLQCRFYHVGVAASVDPTLHCQHASPQSATGVCAAPAAGIVCPTGSNRVDFTVSTAPKAAGATGYPTGYTVNGVLQAPVCLNVGDCAVFAVNTPDCFHPFYIDATGSATGGVGLTNAIVSPQLASTANFGCSGAAVAFYANAAGSFSYQCSSHSTMGAAITVQASCPASSTPVPAPSGSPSPSPAPPGTPPPPGAPTPGPVPAPGPAGSTPGPSGSPTASGADGGGVDSAATLVAILALLIQ